MNRITMFSSMSFVVAVMPIDVVASPIVEVKTDYYSVSGRTAKEIRNDLNRKTPVQENKVKYDGETTWSVEWDFWWNESHGRCSITNVTTKVDIQYILPKLAVATPLPQALQQKWDNYMQALTAHEVGHKNMGVGAANEIEQKIKSMASRPTCKQLESDANRLGAEIITKYNYLDDEFDRRTNHGINDGVIFP